MSNNPEQVSEAGRGNAGQSGLDDAELGTTKTDLKEVRYSLPGILAELKLERKSSLFAMEILDQTEIEKLFSAKRK